MADKRHGPGVITLLVYLVSTASLSGGLSGWLYATGALDWASTLSAPNWAPSFGLLNLIGLFIPAFAVIALWILQRSGKDGMRLACSLLIALLLAGMATQICIFFGMRDPALGFLAAMAMWVYTLFAAGIVGRASSAAGVLLWIPFAWVTAMLVLGFEFMRLNAAGTFAGGI
ncbi:tryptophan-rich sensory protein [uncultured Maricaulis sp.]|uniref:tryptophan-rich sensory protein n=1 Tax=uncultured Maricaulis sp. TaxID=174710 RepID=UPI00261AA9BF|nr:tryptophan-rich sensory protein [uncultured Maricaulis sp.]